MPRFSRAAAGADPVSLRAISTGLSRTCARACARLRSPRLRSRGSRARTRIARPAGWIATLLFLVDGTAWAIPSPDLILNLFASTAQLFALATVVLGTWLFGGSRRRRAKGSGPGLYKHAFFVSAGLCTLCAVGWALYAADQADRRNERLEAALTRESKEDGKKILDVSLKEVSFSDQIERSDGVATEALAARIAAGEEMQFLDIRESEEFEMGRVPGTRHVRFPDLMNEPLRFADPAQPIVLLCFNGNRSSELCDYLRPLGFDCSFIIGGAEKWVAEERPLDMAEGRSPDELRQIPDYPNNKLLLDTPDVVAILEERPDVLFVDVRYPGEFESGHLPGAVNITMRKLTTPELDAALRGLPKRPVIAPCYDRRSSFFALTLGLRLHRLGYEYLGRYTVPQDFTSGRKDKPHVAAFKAAHAKKDLLNLAAEPLSGLFGSLHRELGSFVLAVLLLVFLVRLLLLPLTLKADRDRLVQQDLTPRIAELKRTYPEDRATVSRATLRLLREHRVRPFLNFASQLVQLGLFTLFFSVVSQAAEENSESFLWMPAIGEADPRYVLPGLFALLLAVQVLISGRKTTRARTIGALAAVGAAFWLVQGLSVGVNLYLCANLVLLVAQTAAARAWFRRDPARDAARRRRKYADAIVVPLGDAHLVPQTGNKAARLGRLIEAGLPVPEGFAVTQAAVDSARQGGGWASDARAAIERAHAALGARRVAVRSSGLNEDGSDKSYAGVFDSLLDVERERLFEALDTVAASLSSARSQAYFDGGGERGGIIVQAMVPADYAGVLFTEHPGESGAALVELAAGLGDGLVSGRAAPLGFRLGRYSGQALDRRAPPIDLAPLFGLGREIERLFGRPQDIEWAWANGRFFVLQARDITRLARDGADSRAIRERERGRLLDLAARSLESPAGRRAIDPDEIVFAQNELSELLPRPTPFSLALMSSLWEHGGPADLACRSLGIAYDVEPGSAAYVVGAFGALYVDRIEERRRVSRGPSALAAFRLARGADEIERSFREDWLPGHLHEAKLRAAIQLGRLSLDDLAELLRRGLQHFRTETCARAETVNVAADFYFKAAVRQLEKSGLEPAPYVGHPPTTLGYEAFERLAAAGRGECDAAEFLALFGHRAPKDYELAEPRYAEDPALVRTLAARLAAQPTALAPAHAGPVLRRRVLALAVERARRWQTLKEEAKHHALHDLAWLRRLACEIGRRLAIGDGVFQFTPDEVAELPAASARGALLERIRAREEQAEALAELCLGGTLSLFALEGLDVESGATMIVPLRGSVLRGTRVSGSGDVVGRVRILRSPEEIDRFCSGEILVARFTDPTWMPIFSRARGIITEIGGWLSHAAITAREYDVPAIVGADGALDVLADGDIVRLGTDGTIGWLDERRHELRIATSARVTLRGNTGTSAAAILDYSSLGAAVLLVEGSLEIGEEIELDLAAGAGALAATVIRNGTPGAYGVRFEPSIGPRVCALLGKAAG